MEAILLPQVGQDIKKGKIVEWHKKVNEPVAKGDVIATVESEKATFEVEAEASGVLLQILFRDGEEAEVLKPIGYIGAAGETVAAAGGSPAPEPGAAPAPEKAATAPSSAPREGKTPASPVARRLAAELGVDLATVVGTGPGGRIQKEDVLAAANLAKGRTAAQPAAPAAAPADEILPFDGMRRTIAERLTRSKQTIPHLYLFLDVEMENALAWRETYNAERKAHVTITDQIVFAVARALQAFPRLNGHVCDNALHVKRDVNVGVATSVDGGLLVPVVKNADRLSLPALAGVVKRITEDARGRKLPADAVGGFTITSLGMFGVRALLPIINPPECGILGVGAVEPRVVARETPVVRRMMTLTMAADHRAVDGVYAAGFLRAVKETLEAGPEAWNRAAAV
jgi:pyruvate dehydrogenase E2 component (dihydrolipoamide acetyltransferase)